MDSIVLRDRNGKEINYHGIDYLNVKTPDGETQGYAAYDPETLVPENLVSGVVVGDVEGALEVPQAVETTIDPDFSAGNMEVVPADGQVFSKVSIPKPANLLPENIAEGVDIAGVIGTLESGGGGGVGQSPCVFSVGKISPFYGAGSSSSTKPTVSLDITLPVPKNAIIYAYLGHEMDHGASYTSSTAQAVIVPILSHSGVTLSETDSGKTINFKKSFTPSYRYIGGAGIVVAIFSLPGIYYGDESRIYADQSATEWPESPFSQQKITTVNLATSNIAAIPQRAFQNWASIVTVELPSSIVEIGNYCFSGCTALAIIDMSRASSVPTLGSSAIPQNSGLQIRVPAALYDQWIAATNWSSLKSYIVAV